MIKKILLFVSLLVALVCNAYAQQLEIGNVSAKGMPCMKVSDDGTLFYTYYFEDAPVNEREPFVITLYNRDFMEMKKVTVPVSVTNSLVASAFNGEVFAFIFVDANKKTRTMLAVDRNGNIMKNQDEENVPAAMLKAESYIGMRSLMPDFILIRAGAKNEFVVERMDARLDVGVKGTFDLDGNKPTVEDVHVLNDILFLLYKDTDGNKVKYTLQAVRLGDGKQLYKTLVGEGGDIGHVMSMRVNDDMTVTAAGSYFSDGNLDNIPSGVFTMSVDMNGKPVFERKSWHDMNVQVNNKTISAIAAGTMDVLIEDAVVLTNGRQVYIGEIFEKANGGAGTSNFTISDFVLISIGTGGDSITIERVAKPVVNMVVRGPGATVSKYVLASTLHDKHFFPYRSAAPMPEKSKLLYRYDHEGNITLSFVITPDTMKRPIPDVIIASGDNTNIAAGENNGKKAKDNKQKKAMVYNSEVNLATFEDVEISSPVAVLKENRALVSRYNAKDRKLKVELVQLPGGE